MGRRKVADEVEARRCLNEAADSGLERAEWARRNGIDARSLNAWRLNLERPRRAGRTGGLRLVELVPTRERLVGSYRVRYGEFVVEVDGTFDDEVLARLLAVVVRC